MSDPIDEAAIRARAEKIPDRPWYASGRGVFNRGAGFQTACVQMSVNWQDDTEMVIDRLNRGEAAREDIPALLTLLDAARRERDEARASNEKLALENVALAAKAGMIDDIPRTLDAAKVTLANLRRDRDTLRAALENILIMVSRAPEAAKDIASRALAVVQAKEKM
jgi:hypothetical protein